MSMYCSIRPISPHTALDFTRLNRNANYFQLNFKINSNLCHSSGPKNEFINVSNQIRNVQN